MSGIRRATARRRNAPPSRLQQVTPEKLVRSLEAMDRDAQQARRRGGHPPGVIVNGRLVDTRTALREAKRLAAEHQRTAEEGGREERADRERRDALRTLRTAAARNPAVREMVAPVLKRVADAPAATLGPAELVKAARALDRDNPRLRLARGLLAAAARVRRMAGGLKPRGG